jgi:gamma-glutamyltranspeptidase/glutathione hydrolase
MQEVASGDPTEMLDESTETTHFSMIDSAGNMVASTQTINGYFGSGVIAQGTGIFLNNEMDDFSAKPGTANMFGALGGEANSIAPKKTPLSSMSPTLVLADEKPVLAVGAPGGTRILTCVAQTLLNYLEFRQPLYESVSSVRFHHQWSPDVLSMDLPGVPPLELERLKRLGYDVQLSRVPCVVMAVAQEAGRLIGVSDPRDAGMSLGL